MPILPLIDLLMLISISGMMWAFTHKALWLAFDASWTVLGMTPYDFLLGSVTCLLLSLTLAARVWVKANEPALLARQRHHAGEYDPRAVQPVEEPPTMDAADASAAETLAPR